MDIVQAATITSNLHSLYSEGHLLAQHKHLMYVDQKAIIIGHEKTCVGRENICITWMGWAKPFIVSLLKSKNNVLHTFGVQE